MAMMADWDLANARKTRPDFIGDPFGYGYHNIPHAHSRKRVANIDEIQRVASSSRRIADRYLELKSK